MSAFFLNASMSESRPRELTTADLAAMAVGTQPPEARPIQNPPPGSLAGTAETFEKQSRPSDTLLTIQSGGSAATDMSSSRPSKARG